MQDSTRQTLGSIAEVQRQLQREDTTRLETVVQVLRDRQKILTEELSDCNDTFVARRKEYEQFHARVRRLTMYVDLLPKDRNNENILLSETKAAMAKVDHEAQNVDVDTKGRLRELRKAYTLNQPSMPVIITLE